MPDGATLPTVEISCPSSVRVATEKDESALFDLLMALNADNGFGLPVSAEKVMAAIRQGTRRQGALIGIIEADGKIIASIALRMEQFWFSDTNLWREGWLFVRPDYRKGAHCYRDLFLFAEWARAKMERDTGQPWYVITSVWSGKRLPEKTRLWSRFAKQVGAIFLMGNR